MDELVDRVAKLLAAGDREAASTLAESFAAREPDAAALGRAAIALFDQDPESALDHAEQAIALGAAGLGHLYAALAHLIAGNAIAADDHARQAIAIDPNPRARSTYASVLLATGKADEAATLLRALQQEQPDDLDVLLNLAAAASQLRDYREAITCYARAFEKQPADERPLNHLLEMFAELGRWLGAAAALDLTRETKPPADVMFALDMVQLQLVQLIAQGFPDRTIDEDTDRTVDNVRANALRGTPSMQLVVARKLLDLGRVADARGLVSAVAARHRHAPRPDSEVAELRFLEGVLAEESGHRAGALAAYGRSLDADPRRVEACTNAISLLLEDGALDQIPGWLERVPVREAQRDPHLVFNESAYLTRRGRTAEAKSKLERVMQLTEGEGVLAELARKQLAALG